MDPDEVVIATGGDDALILRVGPRDLPDRTFVRREADFLLLLAVIAHTANLYEAFAVDASNLGAVVVELAVVDVVLVLRVHLEGASRRLLLHTWVGLGNPTCQLCLAWLLLAKSTSHVVECHLVHFRVKKECLNDLRRI